METATDSIEHRLTMVEKGLTEVKYVLYGVESRNGVVKELNDHSVRIEQIDRTIIRWGSYLVGAQFVMGLIFTLVNFYLNKP